MNAAQKTAAHRQKSYKRRERWLRADREPFSGAIPFQDDGCDAALNRGRLPYEYLRHSSQPDHHLTKSVHTFSEARMRSSMIVRRTRMSGLAGLLSLAAAGERIALAQGCVPSRFTSPALGSLGGTG